jgi:AcrR family transcriptional regulator
VAKAQRMGAETSETRSRLLDVTEQIMLDDGYAAVSSRRIAKDAGFTPALVHYYFGTLDDLFLAVLRRRAEQQLARLQRILSSPQPLTALWAMSTDPDGTGLLTELMALANHRKIIRGELAAYAEQFRKVELDALHGHLERHGLDVDEVPPVSVLVLMATVSRGLVLEASLGMESGLAETSALIERFLARLDGAPPSASKRKRATR